VSEPADLKETLFRLSGIKKMPEDRLANMVTKNAEKFFGL
jgi:Tat protein secretion system quality control protein TatD with DNase activity